MLRQMTEQQIQDLNVLLWSPSQNAFHEETVREMLEKNWATALEHPLSESDYIVVGLSTTEHTTHQTFWSIRQKILEIRGQGSGGASSQE